LLRRLGPSVQGAVESQLEEFFLPGDVVVDRGLGDADVFIVDGVRTPLWMRLRPRSLEPPDAEG
jgi:hypothetical protein